MPAINLKRALPLVIGILLVLDTCLRLVPLERFAFRAWEVVVVNEARGPATGPFKPGLRVTKARSHGDLSSRAGRPDLHDPRPEQFTTDAWGFRNPPGATGPVAALVNGDSFTAGCGVSDDDTLAAQLGRRLGQRVYNAGGRKPSTGPDLIQIAGRLPMARRLVIQLYLDRLAPPAPGEKAMYLDGLPRPPSPLQRLKLAKDDLSVSRASILVNRWTEAWRGPEAEASTPVRHLLGGAELLFFPRDLETTYAPMEEAPYFPWLRDHLAAGGLELLVVLVPNKYTVYEPLLVEADPRRGQPGWLDHLQAYLEKEHIPVLNLTPLLRRRAAEELAQGRLIYWRDDTHWNPAGIGIAAGEIARRLAAAPH